MALPFHIVKGEEAEGEDSYAIPHTMASTAMLLGPPALRHPNSPAGTVFEDGVILTDSLIVRTSNLELSEKPPLESLA